MAHHQLAHRHERKAQGSFRRCPGAGRRRTTTANQGQGPAASARGGGLAHRRTQDVRREEILSRQPAGKDGPTHLGGHHQGAMDLRAGSPAAPARNSKAGKKESTGRRPSRLCQPCATPSSNSSLGYRRSDARIVENGFATSSGMNKSAKVVLGRLLLERFRRFLGCAFGHYLRNLFGDSARCFCIGLLFETLGENSPNECFSVEQRLF